MDFDPYFVIRVKLSKFVNVFSSYKLKPKHKLMSMAKFKEVVILSFPLNKLF